MVLVPSGEFVMGTDEVDHEGEALLLGLPQPWYEDEHPLHKVYLESFYIDLYEVTHTEYAQFVQSTRVPVPPGWVDRKPPPGGAKLPVVNVSWYEAAAYCQWAGKRLPTEAEWEKAARGPKGQIYPWGNRFSPDRANFARSSGASGGPVAVGQYESGKSPYGVYDMIGNVWEWVDGWYQPYAGNTARNEKFGTQFRVMRGLSFLPLGHYPPESAKKVAAVAARASFRGYDLPEMRLPDVGFRCAQSIQ